MRRFRAIALTAVVGATLLGGRAHAEERTFAAGSLIVPMDLTYQDVGMLQAYGLVFELLRQGVPVLWTIDPAKTWHDAPCDTPGDECPWDCGVDGSGVKCPYPTASPDFYAEATSVWDDQGVAARGTPLGRHGYRGGPFVIDAAYRDAALTIVDAWNDETQWTASPWAARAVVEVVTVHEASEAFTAFVAKEMLAAPTIAVFSDGNEKIATAYLRAAGIPQSSGDEFPDASCGASDCGPGTANPDMLTVPQIMGDMGTCEAPNFDHENGALFTDDGLPAYCQIMSMHWDVNDRELVQCGGGACPDTPEECAGETFTYHGHEVVGEVRSFLRYPVHFFAECQAVNAYENTVPNPAWPYLDDEGRDGHFLTTTGTPPACPCTEAGFQCVTGGCDGVDCCLPTDIRERGAGFLIADQPDERFLQILRPEIAYNQLDGFYGTVGGSEPAYNLSTYLGTTYKNDRDVTFITGPAGPGLSDVWMTGYADGACDISGEGDDVGGGGGTPGACGVGKVSYLGGHDYAENTPLSGSRDSQGARVFLNALFEADCVTAAGQPQLALGMTPLVVGAAALPVTRAFDVTYANQTPGPALDALLRLAAGDGVAVVAAADDGVVDGEAATWAIGSIGGSPAIAGDPAPTGARGVELSFDAIGEYPIELALEYRVGTTVLTRTATFSVRVAIDGDGDGVPDDDDPFPDDPDRCGDSDDDGCDDCSSGTFDPADDGPDADGDGQCDAGAGADGDGGGCGCRSTEPGGALALLLVALALGWPRRRRAVARR